MEKAWWKEAVVYQIYPRSFYDSNGDGIGDLPGVLEKLPYLKELGITVIWLNPVYVSPNKDNGYDISDYYSIMPEFGSLKDFEKLLNAAHDIGIRVIIDLVVNHTSDKHPWFLESKSSKTNDKRNFYIWRDGKEGKEPNNWETWFSQPAWHQTEETDQYYLHLFAKEQPDLNWKNPELRREIYTMMRWWIEKGVDGFRMDVINLLAKPEGLPEAPSENASDYVFAPDLYANQPGIHDYLQEMNREVLHDYDVMTVGETPEVTPEEGLNYTDKDRKELNMIFHFEVVQGLKGKFNLKLFKDIQKRWIETLGNRGWNSQYLSNHDVPRQVSIYGNDGQYREESAKLLATLIHTLPGTPFVYQGEELGMTNVKFPSISDYRDVMTVNYYKKLRSQGMSDSKAMQLIRPWSRDNARTPMQWDDSKNGGFSSGQPWIDMNPNYTEINVQKALSDRNSVFYYYQALIKLRKEIPAIVYGCYKEISVSNELIYCYQRSLDDVEIITAVNFSEKTIIFEDNLLGEKKKLLLCNYKDPKQKGILKPYEARVYVNNNGP